MFKAFISKNKLIINGKKEKKNINFKFSYLKTAKLASNIRILGSKHFFPSNVKYILTFCFLWKKFLYSYYNFQKWFLIFYSIKSLKIKKESHIHTSKSDQDTDFSQTLHWEVRTISHMVSQLIFLWVFASIKFMFDLLSIITGFDLKKCLFYFIWDLFKAVHSF